MTAVYISSGGRRYHVTRGCRALEAGSLLNDWDCPDDCYLSGHQHPSTHAPMECQLDTAIAAGKQPCLVCKPTVNVGPPAWDDFGHRPFRYDGVDICASCWTRGRAEWVDAHDMPRWKPTREAVPWPCATAVVLGIAAREESGR